MQSNTHGSSAGEEKGEVTTYLSIHTLHLDGIRELYRHFLRQDNGTIIEVRQSMHDNEVNTE